MLLLSQLLIALSSSLLPAQEVAPVAVQEHTPGAHKDLIASVEELMQAALKEQGVVGLSLGIGLKGELIHSAGYGLAELEHGVLVDAETMFRIGSVTKQFTSAAICKLADQGELYFDDPLGEYVPEFDTKGREISLRHLLTHTSGIFNYTNLGPIWRDTVALDLSHSELLALVSDKPLDFEPGQAYSYSNTGYFLLGMVIEQVSGLDYPTYLEQNFLKPLGLSRTRYGSNQDLIPNRAQGYQYMESGDFANDELISMAQPYAAGSLLSTGGDLVRWAQALMAGKVVGEESLEEMTLPFILQDGDESAYGFGLSLEDILGQVCISHGGGINGFNSILLYFPETMLCVALISNSEGYSAGELAMRLVGALAQ